MSVSQVKLHSAGASGTSQGTDFGTVTNSYRSQYRVQVSDPLDTAPVVLAYFALNADYPWPGRPFFYGNGFDTTVICKTVDAQYVENSNGWYNVTCGFASAQSQEQKQDGQKSDGTTTQNPLLWHDEIDISFSQIAVPVEQGIFRGFDPPGINNPYLKPGNVGPIVNSALKPYDPTLEEEVDIKVLRITKYTKNYDGGFYSKYQGRVNSDSVTISKAAYGFKESFGPWQGRIKSISGQFAITNGIPHYRQTIEVHIHPAKSGWRRYIIDRGFDERRAFGDANGKGGTISASDLLTPDEIKYEPVKDLAGYPVTEPVLLNGNGQKVTNSGPVYLIYSTRIEIPFSGIRW